MTRIVSDVKRIDSEIAPVYAFISDFNRLGELIKMARRGEQAGELAGKIEEVRTTGDTCTFVVAGFGEVGMKIEERQEPTLVKFGGDGRLPFAFNVWIQLLEHAPGDTRLRVTCEAGLNMMMKMMLKGKLEKGIDQLAEGLARLPYALMH
ncbi:MAG: SRPBCC family protein [Odoribacteraceae bacterium]|jgi:carbon monoxide dehydrogenase subunit G|nr:SRPBCC family protein [Odoribacteraceae bacterium]